jgi:hypothetical protein
VPDHLARFTRGPGVGLVVESSRRQPIPAAIDRALQRIA